MCQSDTLSVLSADKTTADDVPVKRFPRYLQKSVEILGAQLWKRFKSPNETVLITGPKSEASALGGLENARFGTLPPLIAQLTLPPTLVTQWDPLNLLRPNLTSLPLKNPKI